MARFMMKTLVTDCRIFLSIRITVTTREFPTIPKTPMKKNRIVRIIIVPRDTGGSIDPPGELYIPVTFSIPVVLNKASVKL